MFDFVSLPQTHVSNAGGEIFFRQLACTKYHDFIICDEGTAEGCLRSRFQGKKKELEIFRLRKRFLIPFSFY